MKTKLFILIFVLLMCIACNEAKEPTVKILCNDSILIGKYKTNFNIKNIF